MVSFYKLAIRMFIVLFIVSKGLYAVEPDANATTEATGKLYMGLGINGYSNGENNDHIKGVPLYYDNSEWNDTRNAVTFFIGYNVLKSLAIELEYNQGMNNTGNEYDHDTTYVPGVGMASIVGTSKSKYKSYSAFYNMVGKHTFANKHTPFVKVGVGYSNSKNTVDGTYTTYTVTTSYSYSFNAKKVENGISYKVGFGYEYAITRNHSFLIDYNYIITPDTETTFGDSNGQSYVEKKNENYSKLGFTYKFTF